MRRVHLVVGRTLHPVEDVIGRHVKDCRAARASGERHVLRAKCVVTCRARRIRLAAVDAGERGEVHDRVGTQRWIIRIDLVAIPHVEVGARERVDLMVRRELSDECPAETAGGPGDDEPHAPAPAGRGSVTIGT